MAQMHYTISTPTQTSAKVIDKTLPTVIFLHPVFFAQEIFHCEFVHFFSLLSHFPPTHTSTDQFKDRQLRKFNLIALDFRCHGETTGGISAEYGPAEAAGDVSKFMASSPSFGTLARLTLSLCVQDALNLPACHFVGVSMGSSAAFELAIAHPTKVLSLFLVSPLPETEVKPHLLLD
jgi:pimeloyl-ACP methyl ester carboxylesterase